MSRRQQTEPEPSPDRLPPHAPEMERGALACVLLDAAPCLDTLNEKFHGEASVFYEPRHQLLFKTMMELHVAGRAVDTLTLYNALRDAGKAEEVGGAAYLASLADATPSAANVAWYRDALWDKFRLRQLIQTCTHAITRAYEAPAEVETILTDAEAAVLAVNSEDPARAVKTMTEHTERAIQRVETAFEHRNAGLLGGLATGFSYLDKMLGGLHEGELFLVGARPSIGKTSLLITLLLHVAVKMRLPVAFLSMESSADEIVLRMLCNLARANLFHVHSGMPSQRETQALITAAGVLSRAPIWIDDTPALTPNEFKTRAARLVRERKPVLLGVDHLHEMTDPDARGDERQEAKSAVTAAKWVARVHKLPVLALAQLNRDFEKEGKGYGTKAKSGRKPRMSDIRGHGANEQKADTIGILYRDWNQPGVELAEDEDPDDREVWPVTLEVCKQRNGPTGPCFFTFLRTCMRYEDATGNTGSMDKKPEMDMKLSP